MRKTLQGLFLLLVLLAAGASTPGWTQEKLSLRLYLGDYASINKVPFVVAYEEGIYEKNGLNVDQFASPSAGTVMRFTFRAWINLFKSLFSLPRQPLPDFGPPPPVRIGGGTPRIYNRVMFAGVEDWIIIASTDHVVRWHVVARPEIASLEQLKGKRLGFSNVGAMTHYIALILAERMGWDPVQDISLISGAQSYHMLENGIVDAFIAFEVPYADAIAAGYKSLFDTRVWDIPVAGSGVNASESWLRDNRESARRFIKSLVEAIALMKKDKDVAFRAMAKWYNITDPQKQELIYAGAAEMPSKPYPSVAGIKKMMEVYDSNEMRKHKPEDFYDDSFVRELDESGFVDSLYGWETSQKQQQPNR